MLIEDLLKIKGHGVTTIVQTEAIQDAIKILRQKRFGALVVRDLHGEVVGLVTERDIIRGLAERGAAFLTYQVEDAMAADFKICRPSDPLKEVIEVMSHQHVRHVPVLDQHDKLCGIISGTDVIRFRLTEVRSEVDVLRDLNRAR